MHYNASYCLTDLYNILSVLFQKSQINQIVHINENVNNCHTDTIWYILTLNVISVDSALQLFVTMPSS